METERKELALHGFSVDLALATPSFQVHDEGTANWVVRKIVEARKYAEKVEAWAAAETRRAKAEENFFFLQYGAQLHEWVKSQLQRSGNKRRSVCLPAGVAGFRSEPPQVVVTDSEAAITWCRANLPDSLKIQVNAAGKDGMQILSWLETHVPKAEVRQTIAKSVLNEHVKTTGERPDGVEVIDGGERFYIR